MLLVLTNSKDETADYLVDKLHAASVPLTRINSNTVQQDIAISQRDLDTTLTCGSDVLLPRDVTHVWFRRPQHIRVRVSDDPGENEHAGSEWSAAIEGFLAQIPPVRWMNHPSCNASASQKLEQLRRACDYNLRVPDTIVTQTSSDLRSFWRRHDGEIIVKPINGGYISRSRGHDSQIYTSQVTEDSLRNDDLLPLAPTLFQQRIDKSKDVRVVIVDNCVHSVAISHADSRGVPLLDVRRDNMRGARYSDAQMPATIRERLVALVRSYRLRFAALDFVIDAGGNWFFLELNPNGQWAWLDIIGGFSIYRDFVAAFSRPFDQ